MKMTPLQVYKALADATRFNIATLLAQRGEMSCHALSKRFSLSQPTVSHHFNKLLRTGIVLMRKEGVRCHYRLNTTYLKKLGINLARITGRR